MRVERDNVGYEHLSAVERLARVTSMLSAAVKYRHNDGYLLRFAPDSRYDPLEIGIMIVGRHTVLGAEHIVSQRIVAYVAKDIYVLSSHCFVDKSLTVARRESRAFIIDKESLSLKRLVTFFSLLIEPVDKVVIYLFPHILRALHRNDSELGLVFVKIKY